ncbi:MAG: DoxX family protein [Parcubacteria group bacterium]|nr:DoxX family protein [Parcubacteria group bacterium]
MCMTHEKKKGLFVLARIFLSLIFIVAGFAKLQDPVAVQGYMAAMGLPVVGLLFWLVVIIEIGGGLMLLAGYKQCLAAGILAVFLLIVNFVMHRNFAVQMELMNFLKNLAIIGGLMYAAMLCKCGCMGKAACCGHDAKDGCKDDDKGTKE